MAVCDMDFGRVAMFYRFVDMRRSTSPVVEKYRTVASDPGAKFAGIEDIPESAGSGKRKGR